ncbi:hypothetical protein N7454_000516 [Penicillium verhagenii]|nr:hypothetical protein N7454_000516 [Penicillium verhagenii]
MPIDEGRDLIVVSNRLPVSVKRVNGGYQSSVSSGGLVTALSGLKSTKFQWFGWPGIEVKDTADREQVSQSLAEHNACPIFLDSDLADEHYNGFSIIFDDGPWQAYKRVNELFADKIADTAGTGCLIWIHDYHLMLLPEMLRSRLEKQGKACAIGFSLHTPFPAGDFWRALPVRKHLIDGLLASDLIGFHTDEYKQNFIDTCSSLLGARTEIPNQIQYKNRLTCIGKFIVGIDPQKFTDTLQNPEVIDRIKTLEERYKGQAVIVGVDRLDHIKGLTQKLKGFDSFLDDHPELRNKVVLIQVAMSRNIRNWKQSSVHWLERSMANTGTPLLYMHRSVPFNELAALYSIADACLLTSTRDGMNLVSFEYVACQEKRNGVLILSEFAGAASFMREGSICFHPANTTEMSEAIFKALNLDPDERKWKSEQLQDFVHKYTSSRWGQTFLEKLNGRVGDRAKRNCS